ncbi:MAG: DUF1232 domain-containing protein [Erysipelotrichaceae bacterium]|nr:DUF1232 domain-containing protein [Erysipelotrichaceae bacterium]
MEEKELEKKVEEQLPQTMQARQQLSEKIVARFEKRKEQAANYLQDAQKVESTLTRLERKLKRIPLIGEQLAAVPAMISLIRSYRNHEYPQLPLGAIISVFGVLLYFLSPIDVIPDGIPFLGYTDDAALIAVIWKLVSDDVEEYNKWRKKNGK